MIKEPTTIHFDIRTFSLPLVQPFPVKQGSLLSREGCLFGIEDGDGFFGVGELMPLPGMHKETLPQAQAQLLALLPELRTSPQVQQLSSEIWDMQAANQVLASIHEQYERWGLFPSVRFALDMAWLFYLAHRNVQTLCYFLSEKSDHTLPVQALLSGTTEQILSVASQRLAQGYRAFKVKLGRQSLADDILCVQQLRDWVGRRTVLRLDANRAWSRTQATTFVQETVDCEWEYLEEPLQEPQHLPVWVEKTGAPVALDESLGWGDETPLTPELLDSRYTWIHTLILKPHVLGGWIPTQRWIAWARSRQKQVVLSDAFGSGLGRIFLAHWAAAWAQGTPVGLDTGRWFSQDLAPSVVYAGNIDLNVAYRHILSFEPTQYTSLLS